MLTSDLELFKSSIIDDLLASDVMSVSDKDSIRGKDSRRGQNEEFLSYIMGRLSFEDFYRFLLPALRKDHPHLAEALISELDRLEEEYEDEQCVACRARKYVQVRKEFRIKGIDCFNIQVSNKKIVYVTCNVDVAIIPYQLLLKSPFTALFSTSSTYYYWALIK